MFVIISVQLLYHFSPAVMISLNICRYCCVMSAK